MLSSPFLTATLAFDRAAIMRTAWGRAKAFVAGSVQLHREFPGMSPSSLTLQDVFRSELRRVWDEAKGLRALAIWQAEQTANATAEKARREALTERARLLEDAHTAVMFAEHSDAVGSYRLVTQARNRLRTLQQTA